MAEPALDEVADELYGLHPSEFTAARNARAAEAKQTGDAELAQAIKALPRPTTSAWAANLLVRERTEEVRQLQDLARALREAQTQLSAEDLRALAGQRRAVVGALVRTAQDLAREEGHPLTSSVADELQGTLDAALSDEDAAAQLASGQLASALSYAGLGDVASVASVATSGRPAASGRSRGKQAANKDAQRQQELEQERARLRAAAEKDLADARRALEKATSRLEQAKEQRSRAEAALDEAAEEVRQREGEEASARKAVSQSEQAVRRFG